MKTREALCVVCSRFKEIRLQTVHTEAEARLPHSGERPDPGTAAAAFPDVCGGFS